MRQDVRMKTSPLRALVVVALSVLALAGCTLAPTPSPSPTAAPEPMSIEQAGQYYLDTVCPSNAVAGALSEAYAADDLGAFTTAAATARDAYKASATRFASTDVTWPDPVTVADILVLRDASIALATAYEELTKIVALDEANSVSFPDGAKAGEASQRIRTALDLSSDPEVSCG